MSLSTQVQKITSNVETWLRANSKQWRTPTIKICATEGWGVNRVRYECLRAAGLLNNLNDRPPAAGFHGGAAQSAPSGKIKQ